MIFFYFKDALPSISSDLVNFGELPLRDKTNWCAFLDQKSELECIVYRGYNCRMD